MKVDLPLISRLEHLARLQLSEAERPQLLEDLNRILEMVEKLEALDTEGVAPLAYINEDVNVLRPDEPKGEVAREAALRNAPEQDGRHFLVPKVIDNRR